MKRKIYLTLLLFFIGGISLRAEDSTTTGQQQFEGFNLAGYSDTGEKTWDVKGDTADIMGKLIKLTNIVANAYGQEQANLTAKSGTLDQESGDMHLEKDVIITGRDGLRMTTDYLDWQKEKDVVRTDAPVKIIRQGMTATGTGMIAHPNLKLAQLNKDVTVHMDAAPATMMESPLVPPGKDKPAETDKKTADEKKADQQPLTVTCDGPLEIDQGKQVAVFQTNVVAMQEGRELKADRVELYFDKTSNRISQMVCTGNVAITQGGNTSYSQKAVYNAGTQKLTLEGRPKLIMMTEGKGAVASFGN